MKALTKVYVYVGEVNDFAQNEILPEYALGRVEATSNERVISEKKAVYGVLGFVLKHLGIMADVRECFLSETGKPMHENFNFSISHSKGVACVCVSLSDSIGVDIEPLESEKRTEKLFDRIKCHGEENVNSLVLWTQKEAAFKCAGTEKSFVPKVINTLDYKTKSLKFELGEKSFILSLAGNENFDAEFFTLPNGKKMIYSEI